MSTPENGDARDFREESIEEKRYKIWPRGCGCVVAVIGIPALLMAICVLPLGEMMGIIKKQSSPLKVDLQTSFTVKKTCSSQPFP